MVPSKAAQGVVTGCGWHGMQGVRPSCLRVAEKGGWIGPEQASYDPGRAGGGQVRPQEGADRQVSFKLVAGNRQVIATSETYESKASAINGMESVKRKAPTLRSTSRPTRSPVPSRTSWSALRVRSRDFGS